MRCGRALCEEFHVRFPFFLHSSPARGESLYRWETGAWRHLPQVPEPGSENQNSSCAASAERADFPNAVTFARFE